MKKTEIALMLLGAAMFAVMAFHINMAVAGEAVKNVGFGFILIIGQETAACALNTLGWKYSIPPAMAAHISFKRLLAMRIAGDGLNYLTPSATLAGEWARTGMMDKAHSFEARLSSVALAKITQTLAMAAMSTVGIIWALNSHLDTASLRGPLQAGLWLVAAIICVIILLEIRAGRTKIPERNARQEARRSAFGRLKAIDGHISMLIKNHPGRFAASTLCFLAAYLWGMVEVYIICLFIGMPVSPQTALLIEMLSVFLDAIFFAVPGKAGTQEATKTAIFVAMGLPAAKGLAFGIVRHIREIFWAGAGLLVYFYDRKNFAGRAGG